jgi:hypothetical protein
VSKKTFCTVPSLWTLDEYARHRCDDHSHKHISHAQVLRAEREGRVRWLRRADREGNGAVLKLTAPPLGRSLDRAVVRGLSCRVGEHLARGIQHREAWALVMLAQISMRMNSGAHDASLRE